MNECKSSSTSHIMLNTQLSEACLEKIDTFVMNILYTNLQEVMLQQLCS